MKTVLSLFLGVCLFCLLFFGLEYYIRRQMEYAYFEGQKDYMNQKISIAKNKDGCYYWVDSPWNDDRSPNYQPVICNQ